MFRKRTQPNVLLPTRRDVCVDLFFTAQGLALWMAPGQKKEGSLSPGAWSKVGAREHISIYIHIHYTYLYTRIHIHI